jgi:hypothetical protein
VLGLPQSCLVAATAGPGSWRHGVRAIWLVAFAQSLLLLQNIPQPLTLDFGRWMLDARLSREGRAAFPAEFKLRRILFPTVRTPINERTTTFPAEFLSREAVKATPCTVHPTSLLPLLLLGQAKRLAQQDAPANGRREARMRNVTDFLCSSIIADS